MSYKHGHGMYSLSENKINEVINRVKESQKVLTNIIEEQSKTIELLLEILEDKKNDKKEEIKLEIIKIKDPLEEIKSFNYEFEKDKSYSHPKYSIMVFIIPLLQLYESNKISASFKELFLKFFRISLDLNEKEKNDFFDVVNLKEVKKRILKVRDIRWLLLEMEKYPQYFEFSEEDLEIMKENNASRDNISIVKKFLKKDGEYEEYYTEEQGSKLKKKFNMSGGKLNGLYQFWFPNGQKYIECVYKDGKEEGLYQQWHPNGEKWEEYVYKDGQKEGLYQSWYSNGQKLEEWYYKKDKKEGFCQGWFRSGKLWYNCNYKEDKRDGLYREWCNDRQKKIECTYKDGKEEGINKKWYVNGQKWCERNYKEGKYDGFQQCWYENGQKCFEWNYINGKRHGERKEWNEQGQFILHEIYHEGELIEKIL